MRRWAGRLPARVMLVAGATLLGSACSPEAARPPTGLESPVEGASAPAAPRPAPGTARVEFADGRVSLWSNGATLLEVLAELAERGRFELLIGDVEARVLTVEIQDAALADALDEVLGGLRYSLEYEPDPDGDSQRLIRLVVGHPASVAAVPPASRPGSEPVEAPPERAAEERMRQRFDGIRERIAALSPEERERLREEHLAWAEAREPELLAQLEDADPELRRDAVEDLPVEGAGSIGDERVWRMASILAEDPDRRVRIAAVERLGEVSHPEAQRVVVDTLWDPDPGVVLAAIEALENLDDRSVIPDLEPLLQHSNPEIREAAEFAIEWLQW